MLVEGYCRIYGWTNQAMDDLENLLEGASPEWQNESWTGIRTSENWDISRYDKAISIASSKDENESFCLVDLGLMIQSVMRHYNIEDAVCVKSWGLPEDGEDSGDGQITYVTRYGMVHINPFSKLPLETGSPAAIFEQTSKTLDSWKKDMSDLLDPDARAKAYANFEIRNPPVLWASEENGNVIIGEKGDRRLDVSSRADPEEIICNCADIFPKIRQISAPGMDFDKEIREAAHYYSLGEALKTGSPRA